MVEKEDNLSLERYALFEKFKEHDVTGGDGRSMRASFEAELNKPQNRNLFPNYDTFDEYVNMIYDGASPEKASTFVDGKVKDGKLVKLANSLLKENLRGKQGLDKIKNVLFEIGELGFDFTMLEPEGYDPAANSHDIRKFCEKVVLYANDEY